MRRMTWGVSSKGVQRSFLQATRNLSILSRTALSAAMSTLADLDQQYNTTLVDPTQVLTDPPMSCKLPCKLASSAR